MNAEYYVKHDQGMWYIEDQLAIANLHGFCFVSEMIESLYEAGFLYDEIAYFLGVTKAAIRYQVVKMGLKIRTWGGYRRRTRVTKANVTGVYMVNGRWQAYYHYKKKDKYLGTFGNQKDAAKVRLAAEKKHGYPRRSLSEKYLKSVGELSDE